MDLIRSAISFLTANTALMTAAAILLLLAANMYFIRWYYSRSIINRKIGMYEGQLKEVDRNMEGMKKSIDLRREWINDLSKREK